MATNPEQIKPQDLQRETVEQPQPTSEKPEPTEADFEKMTEQAETAVSDEETRVLDSANKRLEKAPASVGLDSKKVESIFSSGGFADRIKAAKEKIAALAKNAKDRLKGLRARGTSDSETGLGDEGQSEAKGSREYGEVKESLKREREISVPVIEEARQKRDLILEKRGLLQMSKEEFNTYFAEKKFEIISDLKQGNVGDCYVVASIHSMSRSPNFEMLARSSMKRLPDGSWQVRIPFLGEQGKLMTITPAELLPQKNSQFLKFGKDSVIPDLRMRLDPVKGKEGLQVLEAAYMKSELGKVDRLMAEGGSSQHVLKRMLGEDIQRDVVHVPQDILHTLKSQGRSVEDPKLMSFYQKQLATFEHFMENFDPEINIATASTKSGSGVYRVKGTGKFLVRNHVYSIVGTNAEKKTIKLANPWNTSKPFEMTFDQFNESFSDVEAVRIDNAKLLKSVEKTGEQ